VIRRANLMIEQPNVIPDAIGQRQAFDALPIGHLVGRTRKPR
jgi:hypothetical protein